MGEYVPAFSATSRWPICRKHPTSEFHKHQSIAGNMLAKIYKSITKNYGQRLGTCAENVSIMAYFNFLCFPEEKEGDFRNKQGWFVNFSTQ